MPFGKRRERIMSGEGFKQANDLAKKLLKQATEKKKDIEACQMEKQEDQKKK